MRFFSPNFEWLMLALIATTLATCCVQPKSFANETEKKPFVLEEQ